jgi:hypothetical protein
MDAKTQTRLRTLFDQLPTPNLILEIGSGRDPGSLFYYPDVPTCAVDLDAVALQSARKTNPHSCFFPIAGDAARLPLRADFDLILVRHPDVDKWPDRWVGVWAALATRRYGILIVTTYGVHEMTTIRSSLGRYANFPLRYERLAAVPLSGADRYVWVGIKEK